MLESLWTFDCFGETSMNQVAPRRTRAGSAPIAIANLFGERSTARDLILRLRASGTTVALTVNWKTVSEPIADFELETRLTSASHGTMSRRASCARPTLCEYVKPLIVKT